MSRKFLAVLVLIVATTMLSGWFWSKGYEKKKVAGTYEITLKANGYPLTKGDNALTATVADTTGKPLPEDAVIVRYSMPPMPGMAPMSYTTRPVRNGNDYLFTANVPMEGMWKVEITVAPPSGQPATAVFNLDAR